MEQILGLCGARPSVSATLGVGGWGVTEGECHTDRGRFGGLEGRGTKADAAIISSSDIRMNDSCYNTMIAPI